MSAQLTGRCADQGNSSYGSGWWKKPSPGIGLAAQSDAIKETHGEDAQSPDPNKLSTIAAQPSDQHPPHNPTQIVSATMHTSSHKTKVCVQFRTSQEHRVHAVRYKHVVG